jgi:hypothetical protein
METCVLIPQEFSLVMSSGNDDLFKRSKFSPSKEVAVNVWTNAAIPQGTLIYPFQGTIRLDKLEVYNYLEENDVSGDTCLLFILALG